MTDVNTLRYEGSINTTMKTKHIILIFCILIMLAVVDDHFGITHQSKLQAQAYPPREEVKAPTAFGKQLSIAMRDFRLQLVNREALEDRCNRGVVCFSPWRDLQYGNISEHSTNSWSTVANAIKDFPLFERKSRKSQIRIIQKDAILQSSIDEPLNNSTGILQCKLNAGDIILLLPLYE